MKTGRSVGKEKRRNGAKTKTTGKTSPAFLAKKRGSKSKGKKSQKSETKASQF